LSAAVSVEAEAVVNAANTIETLLEGESPAAVGEWAAAVGESANESGFFRSQSSLGSFRSHAAVVSDSGSVDIPDLHGGEIGATVRGRQSARKLTMLAHSLESIRDTMNRTKEECERSGSDAGDLSSLRRKVQSQLEELDRFVKSLEPEGRS
jgi:hypothetical protein